MIGNKTTHLNIGTDFTGVGAFEQSLTNLKIANKTIFACDMDKYSRKTFVHNFGTEKDKELLNHPDVVFCDDMYYKLFINKKLAKPTFTEIRKLLTIQEQTARLFSFYYPWNVNYRKPPTTPLDFYVATPPCQAFSLAGKREGENDDRGILFYNSHQFIKKNKPRFFIFENVKGLLSDDKTDKNNVFGKTFNKWIDLLGGKTVNGLPVVFPNDDATPYHIYYKVLNAKHYNVPQNRERIFIIGIRDDVDNTFTWPKKVPLLKKLKDILEKNVDKKNFLTDDAIASILHNTSNQQKSAIDPIIANTLQAPGNSCGVYKGMNAVTVKSATKNGFEIATENDSINLSNPSSKTRRGRVGKQVAQTLTTSCYQGVLIGAIRGRNIKTPKSRKPKKPLVQLLELNLFETSNALTTVQKDNVVVTKNYIQYDVSGKGYKSQQDRLYFESGVMCTIPSQRTENKVKILLNDYNIRKLTPRECFRLMGFPDTFKLPCSDTQTYKQAGNSIVKHVLVAQICRFIGVLDK